MKILFLDIDGVLNSDTFYSEHTAVMASAPWPDVYPYSEFDWRAVERLRRIISDTGCEIVLSSSWRLDIGVRDTLALVGIGILDVTPYMPGRIRGEEIDRWLAEHTGDPVESYVILDDTESFMRKQRKRVIRCRTSDGLTDAVADRTVAALNG